MSWYREGSYEAIPDIVGARLAGGAGPIGPSVCASRLSVTEGRPAACEPRAIFGPRLIPASGAAKTPQFGPAHEWQETPQRRHWRTGRREIHVRDHFVKHHANAVSARRR
jgi:hypothetical protein